MKLVRDARTLRKKAVASLRIAISTFNSYDDEGRVCSVLLHLQHACEMLLKAVLCQRRAKVFDRTSGKAIGFEKCLGICQAHHGLTPDEAGAMRAVDALRDAAQHWYVFVSEDILFMHARAIVTAFDAYMKRTLGTELANDLPARVLPISTKPPADFEFLVDREYKLIGDLLQPGRRQRDEARARIRALLPMEAIVTDEVGISEKDIDRIEKAVRDGQDFSRVFPRLLTVSTTMSGEGVALKVHFSKKEGAPVRFVTGDDPEGAAAVREVDLQKKFHMGASTLADKLKLSGPKAKGTPPVSAAL